MTKTTLQVTGMHCASCAANIETTLNKEKGVSKVSVNFGTAKAIVEHDSALIGDAKLIELIKGIGFSAEVLTEADTLKDSNFQQKEVNYFKKRFLFSLIFAIPAFIILSLPSFANLAKYSVCCAISENISPGANPACSISCLFISI